MEQLREPWTARKLQLGEKMAPNEVLLTAEQTARLELLPEDMRREEMARMYQSGEIAPMAMQEEIDDFVARCMKRGMTRRATLRAAKRKFAFVKMVAVR